jgi:hypothetical protein
MTTPSCKCKSTFFTFEPIAIDLRRTRIRRACAAIGERPTPRARGVVPPSGLVSRHMHCLPSGDSLRSIRAAGSV